ncbi:SLAC1 family transporter [Nonomuraea sp. NPDC003707]
MATGIVSEALDRGGTRVASAALLVVAGAGFVTLSLAYGWSLLRRRTWPADDLVGEGGFAVLTIAAASNVLARLLVRPLTAEELRPHYWIFMGAAAISVLTGAQLLNLPSGAVVVPREFTVGVSLVLWAFCSWLIPLLVALGLWRHVRCRVPLRWEWGLWSMVFPVGMYGVATRELGRSTGMGWMTAPGDGEVWPAAAVWLIVFSVMIKASFRLLSENRAPRLP